MLVLMFSVIAKLTKENLDLAASVLGISRTMLDCILGGATSSFTGFSPVLGPGRAAGLFFRPLLQRAPRPSSIRTAEISSFSQSVNIRDNEQKYHVVYGEKGVGKTCMIKTALHMSPGVVYSEANPGDSIDTICQGALSAVARRTVASWWKPDGSARRAIFWYRLFCRHSPIVVISASERTANKPYADLAGAARCLTDKFKLNVIVDASPNALDTAVLETRRARKFKVERFTREQILSIPENAELYRILDNLGMTELSWQVLGGNPADFADLRDLLRGKNQEEFCSIVEYFLTDRICGAIRLIRDAKKSNKDLWKLIEELRKRGNCLPEADREKMAIDRNDPDKVLRLIMKNGKEMLVPASNALDLVIRHDLSEAPPIDKLQGLINTQSTQTFEQLPVTRKA
jgi:hypothetical protein